MNHCTWLTPIYPLFQYHASPCSHQPPILLTYCTWIPLIFHSSTILSMAPTYPPFYWNAAPVSHFIKQSRDTVYLVLFCPFNFMMNLDPTSFKLYRYDPTGSTWFCMIQIWCTWLQPILHYTDTVHLAPTCCTFYRYSAPGSNLFYVIQIPCIWLQGIIHYTDKVHLEPIHYRGIISFSRQGDPPNTRASVSYFQLIIWQARGTENKRSA